MKKIRDILVLIMVAIPLALFILFNHLILIVSDLFGIGAAFARGRIRRRYEPAARPEDPSALTARRDRVLASLALQGYAVGDDQAQVVEMNGVFALRVPHQTARNSKTGYPKYAYYVEGTPFEMGRFIGILAENDVERMSVDYVNNVIFDYAGGIEKLGFWGNILADFLYRLARWNDAILPEDLSAELYGVWAGSLMAKSRSKVRLRDLYVLNYGVDVLLGYVYAGFDPILKFLRINIADFRPVIGCNAFSARADAAKGGHFFGRDFMFPTCNVYTDVAAHGVFRPVSDGHWHERSPHRGHRHFRANASEQSQMPKTIMSFFAPGMAGSVLAVNENQIVMGLDMVAGRNTSWTRVGLNSLPMVRYAVSWAESAKDLIEIVADAPRGITWLYPFADGQNGIGGVMETGLQTDDIDWLRYVPDRYRSILPKAEFIAQHQSEPNHKGMFARLDTTVYPKEYLEFNPQLFTALNRPYDPSQWGERGLLNSNPHGDVMPEAYYFAPQREERSDLMLVGNHFILPEMRLLAMNEWTCVIPELGKSFDDFQWRYDRLNQRLLRLIDQGGLDFEVARDCINFLRPYNKDGSRAEFWEYYGQKNGVPRQFEDIAVGGSISVVDLKTLKVETLWGMYCDQWVGLDFGAILAAIRS